MFVGGEIMKHFIGYWLHTLIANPLAAGAMRFHDWTVRCFTPERPHTSMDL